MENAVKAMYMVAALLISVMIMGLLIYLFRTGSIFGRNYVLRKQQEQIDQFNSKFEPYMSIPEIQDGIYYTGNTIFDVISAANLAYNVNKKNYYDIKNRVEIQVDGLKETLSIGIALNDKEENVLKKNSFFKSSISGITTSTEMIDMNDLLNDEEMTNHHGKLTDTKLNLTNNNIPRERIIYRYYFECRDTDVSYSEETGLVNKLVFTLVPNTNFDTL